MILPQSFVRESAVARFFPGELFVEGERPCIPPAAHQPERPLDRLRQWQWVAGYACCGCRSSARGKIGIAQWEPQEKRSPASGKTPPLLARVYPEPGVGKGSRKSARLTAAWLRCLTPDR